MKRQVLRRSGRQTYSQKWQTSQASSDSESNDDQVSGFEGAEAESSTGAIESSTGAAPIVCGSNEESMYRAALEGDWLAAEIILDRDQKLAHDYVTEDGDRALQVACAMGHIEFVQKLVQLISPKDLELADGRGYTACCYAAITRGVEIALVLVDKNRDLVTMRDKKNSTPLHKAALRGNAGMVMLFLESTEIDDFSAEEWFDLLLLTIRRKMFAAAEKILEINGTIATMSNVQGTALHLLARQDRFYTLSNWKIALNLIVFDADAYWREKPPSFNRVAEKLWGEMQKLEKGSLVELIRKPVHILHEAAKVGHVEMITMLTRSYPQLIWETDSNGYTIFHIAVAYRQYDVLSLVSEARAMMEYSAMSQDQDGNTILHLAAKFAPRVRVRNPQSVILMQREMSWFKCTERLAMCCGETRNKDGLTPRELFSKEHKSLFEYSEMWMKNTADSFMLIATIFLTVVFALAFAVPGGYDGQTGMPILGKRPLFQDFIQFQVMALVFSVTSIVFFRSIIASTCAEDDFQFKLPMRLFMGYGALFLSLMAAILGFLKSIMLVNPKTNVIMWICWGIIFLVLLFWIVAEFRAMHMHWTGPSLTRKRSDRPNLFTGDVAKKTWVK